MAERAGRRGSDNVNQNDVGVMDGAGGGGEGLGEGRTTGKTKTWDGILAAESSAMETTAAASLTQIKSKVSKGMRRYESAFWRNLSDLLFCMAKISPNCF